jgi:membrane-bound lytic murein transglycosylase D
MRPRVATSYLLAVLATPALASASGPEAAAKLIPPPQVATEPGVEAAEAIRAARADLDAMVASLLREQTGNEEPRPTIQVEVTPPTLTSDAPRAGDRLEQTPNLEWLQGLELPDIPVRWHDLLLGLLKYYRDDAHGRAQLRAWLQRSGRYDAQIRSKLKEAGLPLDLSFVAMVESGFEPAVESPAGAVGMWQLVETTAKDYGLDKNRWVDERKSPEKATDAAVRYLKDLHGRLGSWPLTLAAFNMGYGALVRSVRKYNTNDFWLLARLEAGLPYETVAYVAKVMACAIVARNPERFGLNDVQKDPPLGVRLVQVPGGTTLGRIATAAGVSVDGLRELNPELLKKRTPPDVKQWTLRIPGDKAARFARRWPELQAQAPSYGTHLMRFGERIKDVAEMYGTTERKLRALNDLEDNDVAPSGSRLRVPDVAPVARAQETEPTVVGLPARSFAYPERRHIFYRVRGGDSARDIAGFFHVSLDELRLWNNIASDSALQLGMVMQLFVPGSVDLRRAVYLPPERVRVLTVGSEEFFEYHEALRDRVRIRYRIEQGDTLSSLAERYDLSVGSIARINGWSTAHALVPGAEIILYVPTKQAPKPDARQAARD